MTRLPPIPGICTGVAVETCTKRGVAVDVAGNHCTVALGATVAVGVAGTGVGKVCVGTQADKVMKMIMVSIRMEVRRGVDSIKRFYQKSDSHLEGDCHFL